ncbi:hypothetical protein A6A08_20395 [Nocardiopsis sp. TSRI0078]|uniref:DUF6098 family protein n=1 Tax=unclassified Nocardiopsis TaxID=2649073 RepID=UPI00093A9820|nr:DUF6098 family protein [Nocardiopsis sp. TSRI0078]OKI21947.1 hypothetical protein A6A08_20395 [Nocardiopsis sp. TSRI0078]
MDATSRRDGARTPLPTVTGLAELAELVSGRDRLYLRYSDGPDQDRNSVSKDYESGLELPGLSVTVLTPEPWWTRPTEDWLARQVRQYASLVEEDPQRCGWVLQGRTVAHGPDHEPLLDDVRPVAYLSEDVMEEALDRYRRRFEAGRGPTDP